MGLTDCIAAFWYIFQYNFLCSLKKSFRALPERGGSQVAGQAQKLSGAPGHE